MTGREPGIPCALHSEYRAGREQTIAGFVLERLPRTQQLQTASLMRAAWRLNEKLGLAKFRQAAGWLEHDYPDAARSVLEGLEARQAVA